MLTPNINFTTWVPACTHARVAQCVCVCGYAAILHGDSIPRLWTSTGLSLAVTSHHLPVTQTAKQRAAYEQWGDGGAPGDEWQTGIKWLHPDGGPCCLCGESDPQELYKGWKLTSPLHRPTRWGRGIGMHACKEVWIPAKACTATHGLHSLFNNPHEERHTTPPHTPTNNHTVVFLLLIFLTAVAFAHLQVITGYFQPPRVMKVCGTPFLPFSLSSHEGRQMHMRMSAQVHLKTQTESH